MRTLKAWLDSNRRFNIPGPEARAAQVNVTLRQQFELAPNVLPSDVVAAWRYLSCPCSDDTPPITARRKTLAELAEASTEAGFYTYDNEGPGQLAGAVPLWEAVIARFSSPQDGREQAMADTAKRELDELTS